MASPAPARIPSPFAPARLRVVTPAGFWVGVLGERVTVVRHGAAHGWTEETGLQWRRRPGEHDGPWSERLAGAIADAVGRRPGPLVLAGPPALLVRVSPRLHPRPVAHLERALEGLGPAALHALVRPLVAPVDPPAA